MTTVATSGKIVTSIMTLELLESTELDYIEFWCIYRVRSRISGKGLSPPVAKAAVRSKAVVLLLLTFCLLLLPLWESVIVLCFVVHYFMSILVLQSS